MKRLKYPNEESRNLAICELNKKKQEIENSKENVVQKQKQLHNENKQSIDARSALKNQIGKKKSISSALITFGIIAVVATLIFQRSNMPIMIAGIGVGVLLAVLGIIAKSSAKMKKLNEELSKMNSNMAEFDAKNGELQTEIDKYESSICSINDEIEEIKEENRLENYYKWTASTSKGHVAMFVTIDYQPLLDPSTYKPGKKYDGSMSRAAFRYGKIYMDDMVFASLSASDYGKICLAKADPGTHKLQMAVGFTTGNSTEFERSSEPKPFRDTDDSQFTRVHLCISSKGTATYVNTFNDFDEFLNDIGMSSTEFIKKYL